MFRAFLFKLIIQKINFSNVYSPNFSSFKHLKKNPKKWDAKQKFEGKKSVLLTSIYHQNTPRYQALDTFHSLAFRGPKKVPINSSKSRWRNRLISENDPFGKAHRCVRNVQRLFDLCLGSHAIPTWIAHESFGYTLPRIFV